MIKNETVETASFTDCCGNDVLCDCGGRYISGEVGSLVWVRGLKFFERANCAGGKDDVTGESRREEVCSDCMAYACRERPNC